jgi:hypothetical protein
MNKTIKILIAISAIIHRLTTSLYLNPLALAQRPAPKAWRVAFSQLLTYQIQERLLADQFRHGTNWHKTTAFAIPSLYTSYVRVNLRGREPQGIVEPGTRMTN